MLKTISLAIGIGAILSAIALENGFALAHGSGVGMLLVAPGFLIAGPFSKSSTFMFYVSFAIGQFAYAFLLAKLGIWLFSAMRRNK